MSKETLAKPYNEVSLPRSNSRLLDGQPKKDYVKFELVREEETTYIPYII